MSYSLPDLEPEISFKTSRSGGKGGQNVNKVSTKVELNFDIAASVLLSENEKAILLEKIGDRLTKEGILQVISQSERTQLGNKRVALEKFNVLLQSCFVVLKKRKPTKISKAAKEKRLLTKKRNAEIKKQRNYKI
jgi:ribosome-associated protein